jgi:hypothetical protein
MSSGCIGTESILKEPEKRQTVNIGSAWEPNRGKCRVPVVGEIGLLDDNHIGHRHEVRPNVTDLYFRAVVVNIFAGHISGLGASDDAANDARIVGRVVRPRKTGVRPSYCEAIFD